MANRSDPMGVLAVWSARAREMVPHLTEQTTDVRAFQILVEAFRLWEIYAAQESQPADRLREFFMLVEQALARTIGRLEGDWALPGARRVRSRSGEDACISIEDAGWHLLDGQLASGIWGLYRGASVRAGLLDQGMACLSEETRQAAERHTYLALPTHGNDSLYRALRDTFYEIPLKEHLRAKLIDGHGLNRSLAGRLAACDNVDRRLVVEQARSELHEHRSVLQGVIDCENLLSIVEGKGYPQSVRARDTRAHVACIEKVTVGYFSRGSEATSPSHGTRHGHIHPATLKYIGSP